MNSHTLLTRAVESIDPSSLIQSSHELIFITLHSVMLYSGFRWVGLGEDAGSTPLDPHQNQVLPKEWNASKDHFAFRYKHDQSSLTFILKGMKLGKILAIHAFTLEESKTHSMQVDVDKFICRRFTFPIAQTSLSADHLTSAFEHEQLVLDLALEFKSHVMHPLAPGCGDKTDTTTDTTQAPSSSSFTPRPAPFPSHEPFFPPSSGLYPDYPEPNPYGIGDVDLDPFAAAPGMLPPGQVSLGIIHSSRFRPSFPGGIGGGGMVVGPDHPMFGVQGVRPRFPNNVLPPGAVPPGARFDPIGPFGPRPSPGGLYRPQGPRGRGSGQPFSGEPDFDELPPPGMYF